MTHLTSVSPPPDPIYFPGDGQRGRDGSNGCPAFFSLPQIHRLSAWSIYVQCVFYCCDCEWVNFCSLTICLARVIFFRHPSIYLSIYLFNWVAIWLCLPRWRWMDYQRRRCYRKCCWWIFECEASIKSSSGKEDAQIGPRYEVNNVGG